MVQEETEISGMLKMDAFSGRDDPTLALFVPVRIPLGCFINLCQHVEAMGADKALFRGNSLWSAVGLAFGA